MIYRPLMATRRALIRFSILSLAGTASRLSARAEDAGSTFPSRLVRIVVPYTAGASVDGIARVIADGLKRMWGQSVIVENKPGASTMLGGAEVARASADGHTLFYTTDSSITSNPHLFKSMSFDPMTDLVPITQIADLDEFVLVNASLPVNTIEELVAIAKGDVGLNYASYGIGSQPNLLFEMLKKKTGARITHVPYRGAAPAILATIAGDCQMTLASPATVNEHIKAGKLRPLAICKNTRDKYFPDVPTLNEAGYPDIDPQSWIGLFAPKGTPPNIVEKIQRDVSKIINDEDFRSRYVERTGMATVASAPDEFARYIQANFAYKKNMIAITGITVE